MAGGKSNNCKSNSLYMRCIFSEGAGVVPVVRERQRLERQKCNSTHLHRAFESWSRDGGQKRYQKVISMGSWIRAFGAAHHRCFAGFVDRAHAGLICE